MSDEFEDKKECLEADALSTEEKVNELERYIEQMKEEIKQLKKLSKQKEKLAKLEQEKKRILSSSIRSHKRHHH